MANSTEGRRRPVLIKDVAAAAGVALGTVSNVLNRPEQVRPATVAHVRRVMADMGYVRNESARQLRAGSSSTMAYVMPDARNPFFSDVARGIELAAEQDDLSMFICNSDNRPERQAAHLRRLEQHRVDGIVLTPILHDDDTFTMLQRIATPAVLVGSQRPHDRLCAVAVDDVLGGTIATEHLVDRGHRRVVFIGGPLEIRQVGDRLLGARSAWRRAGRPAGDLTVVSGSAMDVEAGREAGLRWLGMPSGRRPTAAVCANDLIALGLLQAAITAGVRVPEDLAIVGYDDIDFAGAAAVPLSSVRQPRLQMGTAAARLARDESCNPDHHHQQVEFTPELVARASTLG